MPAFHASDFRLTMGAGRATKPLEVGMAETIIRNVGVVGAGSAPKALTALRDNLYDAPIPYKVDVVDFDTADQDFATYVFKNEPLIWIR